MRARSASLHPRSRPESLWVRAPDDIASLDSVLAAAAIAPRRSAANFFLFPEPTEVPLTRSLQQLTPTAIAKRESQWRVDPHKLGDAELRAAIWALKQRIARIEAENAKLDDEIGDLTQSLADANRRAMELELRLSE
jgi:septal ring factor EnvC (AmiA/AmiB activator)